MYTYVHVHAHVHVHIRVYILHMHMHMRMHMHTHMRMHIHSYMRTRVCIFTCKSTCTPPIEIRSMADMIQGSKSGCANIKSKIRFPESGFEKAGNFEHDMKHTSQTNNRRKPPPKKRNE